MLVVIAGSILLKPLIKLNKKRKGDFMNYEDYLSQLEWERKEFSETKKPIILFGASVFGQCVKEYITSVGREVIAFCDNDSDKQGKSYDDIIVLSPDEAYQRYHNAYVVICLNSDENIKAVKKQLFELGFEHVYKKDMLYIEYQCELLKRPISKDVFAQLLFKKSSNDMLSLNMVGVLVTERCTLNCKDCSLLMPYYQNPVDYSADDIVESVRRLANTVDTIEAVTLLGGEPLLHKDLSTIAKEVSQIENVERLHILSNGTLMLDDGVIEELKPYITFFIINDYGNHSKNLDKLKKRISDHGMICEIYPNNSNWFEITQPLEGARSENEAVKRFHQCSWGKEYMELQNGKFHICGFSSTTTCLGILKDNKKDYIDFLSEEFDVIDARKKMRELMDKDHVIEGCKVCSINFDHTIERAVQKRRN